MNISSKIKNKRSKLNSTDKYLKNSLDNINCNHLLYKKDIEIYKNNKN